MFGIGKHGPDARYGVIVDVGSASVGIAIIVSEPNTKMPTIIWSHREQMLLKEQAAHEQKTKFITTTLFNAFLELGTAGLKSLAQYDKRARVRHIQLTIAAPWSYTVTKTVVYKKDQPFIITKHLVSELVESAQKQALLVIDEEGLVKQLGLEVITRAVIGMTVNEYTISDAYGEKATQLSLTSVSSISQKNLLKSFSQSKDKVLPQAETTRFSFMLAFYAVLKQTKVKTDEICLIDVTNEATEIGIVREGVLKYVTHAPFGVYTMARDISEQCGVTLEEALAHIRTSVDLTETVRGTKLEQLALITTSYEEKLQELFKHTGDSLAIPRAIFLHADARTESFLRERIKQAAQKSTAMDHTVHLVTSKLFDGQKTTDSALLISAYFFHTAHAGIDFKQV